MNDPLNRDRPRDEMLQMIAEGEAWNSAMVLKSLTRRGVPMEKARELFHVAESRFSVRASSMGCRAEWSIRFAEVQGFGEDFQFDIDSIREFALDEAAEMYFNKLI